jgi:hypothetical protein
MKTEKKREEESARALYFDFPKRKRVLFIYLFYSFAWRPRLERTRYNNDSQQRSIIYSPMDDADFLLQLRHPYLTTPHSVSA